MDQFSAFSAAGLRFMGALAKNNRREWFQPRKAEYEQLLHQPMLALTTVLNQQLERVAPAYAYPNPAKAMNRIYRDIRFSTDKKPYKEQVSALFPQQRLGKKQGAAFFVSISPKEAMVAGGMYFGDTRQLQAVREHLADQNAQFAKILRAKATATMFGELQGETLQRVPRQFGAEHPAADLLRHKQWMLWKKWPAEEVTSPAFAKDAVKAIKLLVPFVEFLNQPLLSLPATSVLE